jgi:hypothetical protein
MLLSLNPQLKDKDIPRRTAATNRILHRYQQEMIELRAQLQVRTGLLRYHAILTMV